MTDYDVEILRGLPFNGIRQTISGSPGNKEALEPGDVGNCYTACIASLLNRSDLDDVPHFQHLRNLAEHDAGHELPWIDRRLAREWLRARCDMDMAIVDRSVADEMPDVHYILTVKSHKGPWNHAVIALGGQIVFDPSGRDDYTMADVDPENTTIEVLTHPYDPDPAALIAMWTLALETAADGAS